jgi:hypothetical protein
MRTILIVFAAAAAVIAAAGLIFVFAYLVDALLEKEDFETNAATAKKVAALIQAEGSSAHQLLIDLGSGRGGFLLRIAGLCPNLECRGIDQGLFRTLLAKTRGARRKNLRFLRGDIFAADISEADIVYAYLPRVLLPALAAKLRKELKPGAIAITSRVFFSDWPPEKVIPADPAVRGEEDIFVYRAL